MLLRILVCLCLVAAVLAGVAVVERKAQRRRRSGRTDTSLSDKASDAVPADAE
jgi:hypothetical protein